MRIGTGPCFERIKFNRRKEKRKSDLIHTARTNYFAQGFRFLLVRSRLYRRLLQPIFHVSRLSLGADCRAVLQLGRVEDE